MKALLVIVVQIVISLFVVASVMPVLLVYVPWLRDGRAGIAVVAVAAVSLFVALRLAWPQRAK